MSIRIIFSLSIIFLASCGPTERLTVPITHPAHVDAEESPVPDRSQTLAGDARLKAISIPADPAPSASPTKTTDAVQTDAHGNAHHQHENKSDAAPSTSQEQ